MFSLNDVLRWRAEQHPDLVALAEAGYFQWSEFQARLITAIAEAEAGDPQHPSRGYFESWLVALEALLDERRP